MARVSSIAKERTGLGMDRPTGRQKKGYSLVLPYPCDCYFLINQKQVGFPFANLDQTAERKTGDVSRPDSLGSGSAGGRRDEGGTEGGSGKRTGGGAAPGTGAWGRRRLAGRRKRR